VSMEKTEKEIKVQSRQKRRSTRTRNKILAAARAIFAEKGLASATIDEIAERADVGRGSFYYHFTDKEEIIGEVLEDILNELTKLMKARCKDQNDLKSLLDSMIQAHIEFFSNRWEDFVLYYQGRADLTLDLSYEGLETPFLIYLNRIEDLVDAVIPQPISKLRLRRLACAIAGFISGYYSFASVASEDENVDKSFMSLRSAFVASLVRFVREALPESGKGK
jgi:AcrR family transcriptional regulator